MAVSEAGHQDTPATSAPTARHPRVHQPHHPGRRAAALFPLALLVCLLAPAAATASSSAASPSNVVALLTAVQQQKLRAVDGASYDTFGYSVAVSGDTALVGASGDTIASHLGQGSVYVFVRTGTTWSKQAKLIAADGAEGDDFGVSVALSGDTAVVGADLAAVGGNFGQGAAYVFVRSGTTWSQQAKLTASDGAEGDGFGGAVALDGDTALVGAAFHTAGSNAAQGSAYVFLRSGTAWSEQQRLAASDQRANDWMGSAVALSGDVALAGAPGKKIGAKPEQGSFYVFERAGIAWSPRQDSSVSAGARRDRFGSSVALSGTTALVGAPRADIGTKVDQGAVYVFVQSSSGWKLKKKLASSDGAKGDTFGSSVALSGTTALVGAPRDTVGGLADRGSAYCFVRSGTTWSQKKKLTASDGGKGDSFGWSVAVSGTTVVVGAPYDTVGGKVSRGSAYIFRLR